MKRIAALVIATVVAASVLNAADAHAVNTSTTHGPGYSFLTGALVGDAPAGMKVYVDKRVGQKHPGVIANYAKPAVAQMAALGVPITFVGFYTKVPSGTGVITITVSRQGCGAGNNKNEERSGYTDARMIYLPKPMNTSLFVDHSFIYICPDVFKVSLPANYKKLKPKAKKAARARANASTTHNTRATVVHELGHSVGLNHTAYKVKGKYQVMYPQANKAATSYGVGDQAGLKRLAAGSLTVKQAFPPIVTSVDSGVNSPSPETVTGTAVLAYFPGVSVHVVLTVTPDGGGSPITDAVDTGPDGAFTLSVTKIVPAHYSLVATSSLNGAAVTTKSWSFF